jgi:hypothetical protein
MTVISESLEITVELQTSLDGTTAQTDIDRVKAVLESNRKMLLVSALESANAAEIENDELYVEFLPTSRHWRDTLSKTENVKILRDACREVLGRDTGIRIVVKDPMAASQDAPLSQEEEERRERKRLRETADKDPVVQQMLRTFRGEIADVRRVGQE